MTCTYNPLPPRAWSRVQNRCVYEKDNFVLDDLKNAYLRKGNVLQYKKNSSDLTKNQRYAQIAKGLWTNRTRTWATQSETYTNPNMNSLKRVNYTTPPVNINNNNNNNLFNCPNAVEFKDGGTLICGVNENPCTGEILASSVTPTRRFYPTSASDVPGRILPLFWDENLPTWYPRQRYVMNNSTNKWPQNYKLFVSAIHFLGT